MNTVVIGSLNTDLIATGIKQFPKSGEHVYGKELVIGPGGKSRNIAQMIACLSPANSVAMVGRTVKDPYGLWQPPVDALIEAGVSTDYITIADYSETKKLPGIALIPVDQQGNNQIFVLPGVSDDFSAQDIDDAVKLFKQVSKNSGVLVLTLECPFSTAKYAVKLASQLDIKVLFDPGGLQRGDDITELINAGVYLIKPNEHEAKVLTGIDVVDFGTAQQAAVRLQEQGILNVLITVGSKGAYLFTEDTEEHIIVPDVEVADSSKDETGCGDQTMAGLAAFIQQGKGLSEAASLAVLTGTLQFYRAGIKPVEIEEIQT